MYCKHCGANLSSDSTYCSKCGKRTDGGNGKFLKFIKKALKPALTIIVILIITLGYIFGYPIYQEEVANRKAESIGVEREKIINQMADLNAKTETLDNDRHKIVEILNASQINNETLSRALNIPILLQGHAEIAAVCKEHAAGCVANGKIYVMQVDARETNDWQTITFDHELLHYVYGSLTENQKNDLNAKLDDVDAKITDSNYRDGLKLYNKNNKEVWHSELFARIGTEIESIPPDLEAYYNQYFLDRIAIVRKNQRIAEFINGLYFRCTASSYHDKQDNCYKYVTFTEGLGATTKPFE